MYKPSSRSPRPFLLRPLVAALAAAVALLALPAIAAALPQPTLFATTGGGGNSSAVSPPSNLYRVDPANGATTPVGNTGYAITGLAQDPTTGVLYGVSNRNSPITPMTLLKIDPATGAATPIGPLGLIIADITFDSHGNLFGWSEDEDNLASINKVTGAATEIGNSEISTYGSGSAFDLNDTYWLFGEGEGGGGPNSGTGGGYHTVDTLTGKSTFRGTLTPVLDANESPVSSAAFDCARTTLYATIQNYGNPPAYLVTIDAATGAVTNKGVTVTSADGLEWYCPLAFEFGSGPISVASKNQTLTLPVVRGPRIKGAASVNFATVPGSAQAGRDFVAAAGTLAFPNNVAGSSVAVTVKRDPKAGKNRKFQIALGTPSAGGTVGTPVEVTILAAKPQRATVKGPKKTKAERPVFRLRAKQLPARFRCKLDKGKFKGCGKNSKKGKKFKTPKLDPGKHKLVVQVVNGAGKKSKPVKKVFTVLP